MTAASAPVAARARGLPRAPVAATAVVALAAAMRLAAAAGIRGHGVLYALRATAPVHRSRGRAVS